MYWSTKKIDQRWSTTCSKRIFLLYSKYYITTVKSGTGVRTFVIKCIETKKGKQICMNDFAQSGTEVLEVSLE